LPVNGRRTRFPAQPFPPYQETAGIPPAPPMKEGLMFNNSKSEIWLALIAGLVEIILKLIDKLP